MNIPFSPPEITQDDIDAVVEVLKSGWITTGPKTKEFEERLSQFCNTGKTVCLNSATAALELTLRFLGIGQGDEVITSVYTYTASASVIAHVGATMVLVDVDEGNYHISPEKVMEAVTSRTKAVIAVDIAGVPCDYDRLFIALQQKNHLYQSGNVIQSCFNRPVLIADAAHSLGAVYKDKKVGSIADFTCFSFHAVKNLTTAEGGAVTWRPVRSLTDEYIYTKFMLFALHGQNRDALERTLAGYWVYDIFLMGYKCNMTDITAALGLSQLSRYRQTLLKRKKIIEQYNKAFASLDIKVLQHYTSQYTSSGHLYPVRLTGKDEAFRDAVMNRMAQNGISANVHYKPLPMHSAYKNMGFNINDFPNAYDIFKNEITLPLYSKMTEIENEFVIDVFTRILNEVTAAYMVEKGVI